MSELTRYYYASGKMELPGDRKGGFYLSSEVGALLAEKDKEIERLRSLVIDEKDWLRHLHRADEAEQKHHELIHLLETITGEHNENYPEMAVTDAVRLLIREKEEAERKLKIAEQKVWNLRGDIYRMKKNCLL